ncbi:hypothetical protein CDAR_616261 [Caerostris darwini]|uniref:Secreted protein n=1 Tax=Caerostris darwini TaxID=1538125 RepID=A0AAV4PU55_9ARAC|nr:hypothetical protein CDAR_616261 [Caerostris darwini]
MGCFGSPQTSLPFRAICFCLLWRKNRSRSHSAHSSKGVDERPLQKTEAFSRRMFFRPEVTPPPTPDSRAKHTSTNSCSLFVFFKETALCSTCSLSLLRALSLMGNIKLWKKD